ncbi:MAG: tRNA/rRNA methyltransferase [Prolixibacteraceae bacterium]|jgi:tRNA/rRNA methyltransferase|nr:tRNA/rRNA methyltransferase [Prolixibacteraceae bacterium]MDD4756106.1 tRNA/rRNA methyltransferase [Prolixibacteraceae bacterium]NLO02326.1 tRNA/rRNA methyltransferase [Bacteroidales bacterium]
MIISFVLVEPAVPENVGAAARAMKTMGFYELLLVNPCNYLDGPARWLAHGSADILENAKVFSSLKDAVSGFDFIIGTTAKKRSVKNDYYSLSDLNSLLNSKGKSIDKAALVFGREESGLKNEELKLCDLVSTVPLKTVNPSLNLAQAVMLYAWELSAAGDIECLNEESANIGSLRVLLGKVKIVLQRTGFDEDSLIFSRFIERINIMCENDLQLLHSFCNKFLYKNL